MRNVTLIYDNFVIRIRIGVRHSEHIRMSSQAEDSDCSKEDGKSEKTPENKSISSIVIVSPSAIGTDACVHPWPRPPTPPSRENHPERPRTVYPPRPQSSSTSTHIDPIAILISNLRLGAPEPRSTTNPQATPPGFPQSSQAHVSSAQNSSRSIDPLFASTSSPGVNESGELLDYVGNETQIPFGSECKAPIPPPPEAVGQNSQVPWPRAKAPPSQDSAEVTHGNRDPPLRQPPIYVNPLLTQRTSREDQWRQAR